MRGPFIQFVMTDHKISKSIFSSTDIKKIRSKKLDTHFIAQKSNVLKFELSFWKLFYRITILVDWKTPILAYQVLLSIGIIDSNNGNNKTKALDTSEIDHEKALWGKKKQKFTKINSVSNVKKQRKLVTQQRFTRQMLEQQQRNSAVKGASPLLFFQYPEDKCFLRK